MLGLCYKSSSLTQAQFFYLITCLAGTFTIVSNDSIRSSDFGFFVAKFIFIVFVEREILMARLEPGLGPGVMIKAPACLISGLGLNPDTSRGFRSSWVRGGGKSSARSDRCTVLPISIHCTCSTMRFVVELILKRSICRTGCAKGAFQSNLVAALVDSISFSGTMFLEWVSRFPAVRFEPKTAGYDAQMLPLFYALAHFIRVVLLNVSETNYPKVLLEAGTSLSFFYFFGQNLFRSLILRMFSFF